MRAPSRELLEKAAFVLSLVLLAFGYGWVSGEQGWFPDELLERAWQQGDREMAARSSPPDFTNRRVYRESGITTLEAEAMQPGLALVDRNGRVHHQWRVQPTELFSQSDYRRGVVAVLAGIAGGGRERRRVTATAGRRAPLTAEKNTLVSIFG